jgi:uncharacterized protein (DUF362 family)
VIRVGLARTQPSYRGLAPPWDPGAAYPELAALLGPAAHAGPVNHVYAAVRAALRALGLDAARFGTPAWNPLSELLPRGGRAVLKPNFIRHWNPNAAGSLDSVITHGSVVRALADYARLAAGPGGRVAIAEAPQHDCDFAEIRRSAGLDAMAGAHRARGSELEIVDLRREEVRYRDGVIAERRALPGDPAGYRLVDLGRHSAFEGSGLDPHRFRGADYDCTPTTLHHVGGRHEYLLSETVLGADLVVNLPKLKTHKKTGVTLALKNLVGINGDKNLLPHHCQGPESAGGDEYPGASWLDAARSRATELARGWLARGRGAGLVRAARRLERGTRGDAFVRSGNWWGNRTTWRMCLDLNRALYYSDAHGERFDAAAPVRRVLSLLDGIVAGEGEGPLAPDDRPLGVILASLDPVALDLAAIRLMGFDADRIPKVREALRGGSLPITGARGPTDVTVWEAVADGAPLRQLGLDALQPDGAGFRPHPGWSGHVEKTSCAA